MDEFDWAVRAALVFCGKFDASPRGLERQMDGRWFLTFIPRDAPTWEPETNSYILREADLGRMEE